MYHNQYSKDLQEPNCLTEQDASQRCDRKDNSHDTILVLVVICVLTKRQWSIHWFFYFLTLCVASGMVPSVVTVNVMME